VLIASNNVIAYTFRTDTKDFRRAYFPIKKWSLEFRKYTSYPTELLWNIAVSTLHLVTQARGIPQEVGYSTF